MTNVRRRYIFDILLTVLLVFEMFFQLTGDFLHEVIGAVFFATIILHLVLSKKWMGATARQAKKGTMPASNSVRLILAIILAVVMVVLLVSSLIISNVLSNITGILVAGDVYRVWSLIHTVSSYGLCIVVVAHLAVHWAGAAAAFKIPYNHQRRQAIGTGVTIAAGIGALAIGLVGVKQASASVQQIVASSAASDSAGSAAGNANGNGNANGAQNGNGNANGNSAENGQNNAQQEPLQNRQFDRRKGGKNRGPEGLYENEGQSAPNSGDSGQNNNGGNSGNSGSDSGNSSSTTEVCPLCHDRCPLSNPRCNRPYNAGLIKQ